MPQTQVWGVFYKTHWISAGWWGEWLPSDICHINVRELFAVWAAVYTWGDEWANQEVVIFSDNKTTVDVWRSGSCNDPLMMRIIRAIFFKAAKVNLNIILCHISGKENVDADLLSRFQVQEFFHRNPQADWEPTFLPPEVWTLNGMS